MAGEQDTDVWAGTELAGNAASAAPSQPSADQDEDIWSGTEFSPKAPTQAPVSGAPSTAAPSVGAALQPVGEKEPEYMPWTDVATSAVKAAPESALEFGKSIVQPILHPIQTAESIGEIGKGIYSKAAGALGVTQAPEQKAKDEAAINAIANFYRDRYGSVERFKHAFAQDPVGVLADASTVLTGGELALARAPGAIGKVGEIAGAVGRAVDPIANLMQIPAAAMKGVSYATNIPLAFQTGTSMKSLNQAFEAGLNSNPVFWEHLHGAGTPEDVVKSVRQAVGQIAQNRSDEYLRGMDQIKAGTSTTPLPYNKVDQAIQDANNVAYYKGSVKNQDAANVLNDINNVVMDWRTNPQIIGNIADFDALKQRIRDAGYSSTMPNTPARKIVDDIANAAKDTIPDKRYADVMEQYGQMTSKLNDLNRELLSGKSTGAQIRKIMKAQDDAYKSNLMSQVAAVDPNIPFMIAGQELRQILPAGLVGKLFGAGLSYGVYNLATSPGAIAAGLMSSPRVVGTMQYGLGKAAGVPSKIREALPYPELAAQAGEAARLAPQQPDNTRQQRATGGAVNLKALATAARKAVTRSTEELLRAPDEHVVKALEVANRHI
jgi:hypothetical protein